jgi:membrane associated rhomboid family serine protease
MFRWIIDDTRALISDLRSLGRRLSTRWQWFRMRSGRRLSTAAAELENVRRGADSTTRMCSSCRALIPVSARRCPECGEMPGRSVSRGMTRVIETMVPQALSVTSVVLGLNVIAYMLQLLMWQRLEQVEQIRDSSWGAWSVTLFAMGANVPLAVAAGEWWRLLSSVFLHGGLLHIAMNCWALLAVGPLVEEMYGARKALVMYVLTGMGGSLASSLWRAGTVAPGVGASGAIFGLIGVALVWGYRRGGALGAGVRAQMAQWAMYGLMMGFLFHFDNAAHLGGFVMGAALAAVIPEGEPRSTLAERACEGAAWLSGLLILASFAFASLRYGDALSLFLRG